MRGRSMLALLLTAALLPGAAAFASADTDAELAVNPKDKMICKRVQRTGTRFYSQTCKTAGQWEALAEQHRRDLKETVDRPQIEIRR